VWPWLGLVARWALAALFLISGFTKLADPVGATVKVSALGMHPALPIVGAVILIQLAGSTLFLTRRFCWIGAGLLARFTIVASIIAHPFWAGSTLEREHHTATFFEHLGLVGGFALAALLVHGERASS
jgi:uncharacterized membrane protein YphA (DoxX/SURF4 family)